MKSKTTEIEYIDKRPETPEEWETVRLTMEGMGVSEEEAIFILNKADELEAKRKRSKSKKPFFFEIKER